MKNRRAKRENALTLVELLVVIATIGILATLLIPTLVRAKAKAREVQCMSNHRQLALAGRFYADDSDDFLARNGYVWKDGEEPRPLWVQGYYNHSSSPRDSTNYLLMVDSRFSLFAPYLKRGDISVYHCPSDRGNVNVGGRLFPRLRSLGMNWSLGFDDVDGGSGKPDFVFLKSTAIRWPSVTMGTVDVSSNSICWPFFGIFRLPSFQMLPGSYHRNGSVLSFCDGHTEYKQWKDPRTFKPPQEDPWQWHVHDYRSTNNVDLLWLQLKSGRP